MWPELAAAFAEVAKFDIPLAEVPDQLRVPRAPGQHDLAVKMEYVRGTRPLVQIIDILGHDPDIIGPLQIHQGKVSGVGLGLADASPPLVVELQNEPRVCRPCFRCGNVLDAVPFPEAIGATEGLQATFGTDPGAGEDDYAFHEDGDPGPRVARLGAARPGLAISTVP